MNYQSAMRILQTARNIERGKPIDRNTRLMKRGDKVAVQLHYTDVVTFAENGDVTLNTGGWTTMTTKDRINNNSPYQVWSQRGVWSVGVNGKQVPYADGMTIHPSGNVTGAGEPDAGQQATDYAEGFVKALYNAQVKAPSTGDCLICRTKMREKSHIESHMEEKYYVPSLLVNAMEEFGASQYAKQIVWDSMGKAHPITTLADALAYQTRADGGREDFVTTQIRRHIRRHVLRQLGLAT